MNMDGPLKRVAIVALLLIFALMINVNYLQGSQAESLQTDKLNARQYQDVFTRPRGKILAGDQILAYSERPEGKRNYSRTYKDGLIFSPVTGYFNGGASKVELAYNSLLDGRDKRITNQRWFDQFIGKKALGADVELTIKPAAQRAAYQALKGSTARRAGAVVIDVKTGAIVVAASVPSFDPNEVAPQTGVKGAQRLTDLEDKANEHPERYKPLVDKALSETFPPGSTFKVVVTALAMEQKGLNKQSQVPTGQLTLPESGRPLPNSHDGGNCAGTAPLLGAFAESCNTTFAQMALDMGIEKLATGSGKFGFGKDIEIEPDFYAAKSDVPVKDPVTGNPTGGDDVARSGIGQANVRATPLQMAMVSAAVANDGKIMKPYLVERVRAADQSEIYSADPQVFSRPMKEDTADQIQEMMRAVVTGSGTATNLSGQNIAGKTGTAETGRPYNDRWFIGHSPIDNPRYAFAVVTEGAGPGATAAGPIAARIMSVING